MFYPYVTMETLYGEVSASINRRDNSCPDDAPFVTVMRCPEDKKYGYYIEDYYSTPTASLASEVIGVHGMHTRNIPDFNENGLISDYLIPIVHTAQTTSTVTLQLTATNEILRKGLGDMACYYTIGEQQVRIGTTFTMSVTPGQTINIYDSNNAVKGAIEFRRFTGEVLEPVLNLVYLDEQLPAEVSLSRTVADLNQVYSTMGVRWKEGKTIHLPMDRYYDDDGKIVVEMINEAIPTHSNKHYYMMVVKDDDKNRHPFNMGVHGYTHGFDKNYFFQLPKYNFTTPLHELGHCNGVDEFVYDFGILPKPLPGESRGYLNNEYQKSTNNVMGYKPSAIDFYSWQIHRIRQNIRNRIK